MKKLFLLFLVLAASGLLILRTIKPNMDWKDYFEKCYSFKNGVAQILKNGKLIYIDKTGKEIGVNIFIEDLSKIEKKGLFGFVDKNGNEIIAPQFNGASDFNNGVAKVKKSNKFGYIDKSGNIVVPIKYEYVSEFEGDVAIFVQWDKRYSLVNCGLVNKKGIEITLPKGCRISAEGFFEGLARVEKNNRWSFVNKSGKIITPFRYTQIGNFNEGLAMVEIDNSRTGFIDSLGKEVIPPLFDDDGVFGGDFTNKLYSFSEGLCKVRKNRKFGFIDKTGKVVVAPQYRDVDNFKEGFAAVSGEEITKKNVKWGFINDKGLLVIPIQYESVYKFSGGLTRAKKGDKWGLIDKKGKEITAFDYDNIYPFNDNLARVKKSNKWGFIDIDGKEIIPLIYDDAEDFQEGLAVVGVFSKSINSVKYVFIDQKGKVILPKQK